MIDITAIHIYYRDFKKKLFQKTITPTDATNQLAIKQDIGEAVLKLKQTGKYEYYYVALEIDRDGKPAFRTVIPKTMF